jgi:hypothetical protein
VTDVIADSAVPGRLVVDGTAPNIRIEDPDGARNYPRTWYDVLGTVAEEWTGVGPCRFAWRLLLDAQCAFLSWRPNLGILCASLLRRRTAYLCWGMPNPAASRLPLFMRTTRLRAILRRVDLILVNDEVTRDEVRRLANREATVVPFVVDTDFFQFAPYDGREDFVLVPGDNDRDENLISELAGRGLRVVRIARMPGLPRLYERTVSTGSVTVRLFVPYTELRLCYQRAAVVLLPLTSHNHAAGQTAFLEAVACGAPVVISASRTSTIIGRQKSVFVCPSRRVDDWLDKIAEARRVASTDRAAVRDAAAAISAMHHPGKVAEKLLGILRAA